MRITESILRNYVRKILLEQRTNKASLWSPRKLRNFGGVFGSVSKARDGKTGYKVQPSLSAITDLEKFIEEKEIEKQKILDLSPEVKKKIDELFTDTLKKIPDLDPNQWKGPTLEGKDEISGAPGYRYDHPDISDPFMISLSNVVSARGITTERTQNLAAYCLAMAFNQVGLRTANFTEIAKKGSTMPDVLFEFTDGSEAIIEVKQKNAYLFDKTMSRSGVTSKKAAKEGAAIDSLAVALAQSVTGVSPSFPRTKISTLADYIDALRKDPIVLQDAEESGTSLPGYAGDGGSATRGSLPAAYFKLPEENKQLVVDALKSHWADGGDNYIAVVSGRQAYVWSTGTGKNLLGELGVKEFSANSFSSARLRNAPAGDGKIRVLVDVDFDLSDGVEMCAEGGAFVNENASSDLHKIIRETLLS